MFTYQSFTENKAVINAEMIMSIYYPSTQSCQF